MTQPEYKLRHSRVEEDKDRTNGESHGGRHLCDVSGVTLLH